MFGHDVVMKGDSCLKNVVSLLTFGVESSFL